MLIDSCMVTFRFFIRSVPMLFHRAIVDRIDRLPQTNFRFRVWNALRIEEVKAATVDQSNWLYSGSDYFFSISFVGNFLQNFRKIILPWNYTGTSLIVKQIHRHRVKFSSNVH